MLEQFGSKVGGWENKKVAVLGLAFKPNTDDMREAPSTRVIPYLLEHKASIVGYDPKAIPVVSYFLKENPSATYTDNIEQAVKDADVIIALIEWPEIVNFNFAAARQKQKKQWIIDARNQLNRAAIETAGFEYLSIGRV